MPVNQGLLALSRETPNFSNQSVQNGINTCLIGFTIKVRNLILKAEADDVLTNSNRSDLNDALNKNSYLNVGQYLINLDRHTTKLLTGELQEPVRDERNQSFLDLLQTVVGFEAIIPSLFGVTADTQGKGILGHFGSLAGLLDSTLVALSKDLTFINSKSLSQDTAFQTAIDNISNYIDTLTDSTAFNGATWQGYMTALETAADNFNTVLSSGIYTDVRTNLIGWRDNVNTQINREVTNLGSIVTYENSLTNTSSYESLADYNAARELLIRASQNPAWTEYFEKYPERKSYDNAPIYYDAGGDSAESAIIDRVLRLKGLPDVTDYVDLDSVARKALRDVRLVGKLSDSGKTTEEIIKKACELLSISVDYKDVYAQSKSLLSNMNDSDRAIIKQELDLHNQVNTLS
jgi:hypothetical protein